MDEPEDNPEGTLIEPADPLFTLKLRIEQIVISLESVLIACEANNTEAISAMFTATSRLLKAIIKKYPDFGPSARPFALGLVMDTADPNPIDAHIREPKL